MPKQLGAYYSIPGKELAAMLDKAQLVLDDISIDVRSGAHQFVIWDCSKPQMYSVVFNGAPVKVHLVDEKAGVCMVELDGSSRRFLAYRHELNKVD